MISIKVRERKVEMRLREFSQQTDMKQQVAATCVLLVSYDNFKDQKSQRKTLLRS